MRYSLSPSCARGVPHTCWKVWSRAYNPKPLQWEIILAKKKRQGYRWERWVVTNKYLSLSANPWSLQWWKGASSFHENWRRLSAAENQVACLQVLIQWQWLGVIGSFVNPRGERERESLSSQVGACSGQIHDPLNVGSSGKKLLKKSLVIQCWRMTGCTLHFCPRFFWGHQRLQGWKTLTHLHLREPSAPPCPMQQKPGLVISRLLRQPKALVFIMLAEYKHIKYCVNELDLNW